MRRLQVVFDNYHIITNLRSSLSIKLLWALRSRSMSYVPGPGVSVEDVALNRSEALCNAGMLSERRLVNESWTVYSPGPWSVFSSLFILSWL